MKGVFTTKVVPEYDDLPERQYHFPRTYLRQAERCVGDWIDWRPLGSAIIWKIDILEETNHNG